MKDSTIPPRGGDRRGSDRRKGASADYAGPERRLGDRRTGADRRRSPRITPLPPAS